ncbi:NACHT domain-containing protein [Streptomyces sp. 2A115]|uniref:NACHT domain-containing protein n=1 Tax=Streptomyces sp. 2A115 TaxID=3457439 RepID=UPI003FD44F6C
MAGSQLLARAGLAALAIVPPAAIVLQLRDGIADRPVLSAVLLVGYELLVLVVGFTGKVFGELHARWAARAADHLDRLVRGRLSRFERRYRQFVQFGHRFTDLKGLATQGDQTPLLREVFVDVSLLPSPLHKVSESTLTGPPQPAPARASLETLLSSPEPVVLAITGAPGTGKTTLLEYTAVRLAPRRRRSRDCPRTLPVFLFLRRHAAAVVADPDVTLADRIRGTLGGLQSTEPPGWFEDRLDQGHCVIMLDGLDEVARTRDRHLMVDWVEQQITRYPRNDWIITSRPHGYQNRSLTGAQTLQVRRFTGEQISRFLHGWYRSIEQISTGLADEGVRQIAAGRAADLLERLRARPMLYDLASNPLLLTMIANVHRYRRALPGSRSELYAEISQVLLFRRQEAKGLEPPDEAAELSGQQKELVLCELAYAMMVEHIRDIPADRAEELTRTALSRIDEGRDPQAFLESIVTSGLLVERDIQVYSFAHQTFQEHLAAMHVRAHRLDRTLVDAVTDPWWREVILLWAAFSDPSSVIEACLAEGGAHALALAFDCLDEAVTVRPQVRRDLEEFRRRALQSPPGSGHRRLMTAITVSRSLRPAVRLTDDVFLCDCPVSREVFQLFAEEFPEASAHCAAARQTAGGAAVGITANAARVFVPWVNGLVTGSSVYRLPSRAELDDPAAQHVIGVTSHKVWSSDDPAGAAPPPPELWIRDGQSCPWSVSGERVRDRLRQDRTAVPSLLAAIGCTVVHANARALRRALDRVDQLCRAVVERDSGDLGAVASRLRDHFESTNSGDVRVLVDAARALARSFTRERDFERAGTLLTGMISALAAAVHSGKDTDLYFAHAVTHDFVNAVERDAAHHGGIQPSEHVADARERARLLADALDLALALTAARGLSGQLDRGTGRAVGGGAAHLLDSILDTEHGYDLGLDVEEALGFRAPAPQDSSTWTVPDTAELFSPVPEPGEVPTVLDPLRGPVLALAPGAVISLALRLAAHLDGSLEHGKPRAVLVALLERYGVRLGDDTAPVVVPPEELWEHLTLLPSAVADACAGLTEIGTAGWRPLAQHLAVQVAALGSGLQSQTDGPHPVTAAALRLGALTLSALGDRLDSADVVAHSRAVALGTTVLQDRADGVLTPSEVLLLVRS